MKKRRKAPKADPKARPKSRNPIAHAVRTARFRPRVEAKVGAYQRRPKHTPDTGSDETDV
jgi:hypothetical protein